MRVIVICMLDFEGIRLGRERVEGEVDVGKKMREQGKRVCSISRGEKGLNFKYKRIWEIEEV